MASEVAHQPDADLVELAEVIVADMGFHAENYVIRLAGIFEQEGNMHDAAVLGLVLEHIMALRLQAGIQRPGMRQ